MTQPYLLLAIVLLIPAYVFQQEASVAETDEHWLVGHWQAEAFGGLLDERWEAASDGGLLLKRGYYIEQGDTTYSEVAKIEQIDGRYYLIALPMGSSPLIFEATRYTETEMVFENTSYVNPYRVHYVSQGRTSFTRTLTQRVGQEDEVTVMEFRRQSYSAR